MLVHVRVLAHAHKVASAFSQLPAGNCEYEQGRKSKSAKGMNSAHGVENEKTKGRDYRHAVHLAPNFPHCTLHGCWYRVGVAHAFVPRTDRDRPRYKAFDTPKGLLT